MVNGGCAHVALNIFQSRKDFNKHEVIPSPQNICHMKSFVSDSNAFLVFQMHVV